MHSYSYEKIKDDPNISMNMTLLNKINGGDNNNGNMGRNFNDPKSGTNTGMMTSIGQNSGEGGNTTIENDEKQKTNTVSNNKEEHPTTQLSRITDFIRIENQEMQIIYDNVTDQRGVFKPSFILFSTNQNND